MSWNSSENTADISFKQNSGWRPRIRRRKTKYFEMTNMNCCSWLRMLKGNQCWVEPISENGTRFRHQKLSWLPSVFYNTLTLYSSLYNPLYLYTLIILFWHVLAVWETSMRGFYFSQFKFFFIHSSTVCICKCLPNMDGSLIPRNISGNSFTYIKNITQNLSLKHCILYP